MTEDAAFFAFLDELATDRFLPIEVREWATTQEVTMRDLLRIGPAQLQELQHLPPEKVRLVGRLIRHRTGFDWNQMYRLLSTIDSTTPRHNHPAHAQWARLRQIHEVSGKSILLAQLKLPKPVGALSRLMALDTVEDLLKLPIELVGRARSIGPSAISRIIYIVETANQCMSKPRGEKRHPWDTLSNRIDPTLSKVVIAHTALPTRMKQYARNHHIETVGELVRRPASVLSAARAVGRKTIADSVLVIEALMQERLCPAQSTDFRDVVELWDNLLSTLPTEERATVALLSGYPTGLRRREMAFVLGKDRSWVYRLEQQALGSLRQLSKVTLIERELQRRAAGGVVVMDALRQDTWWAPLADSSRWMDYVFEHLLESRWSLVEVDQRTFIIKGNATVVEARWRSLITSIENVGFPLPRSALQALCSVGNGPEGLSEHLFDIMEAKLTWPSQQAADGWLRPPAKSSQLGDQPHYRNLWQLWQRSVAGLSTRAHTVLALKYGLFGPAHKAADIGVLLECSQFAVNSLDNRSLHRLRSDWRSWSDVEDRLNKHLDEGMVSVETLDEDPFFHEVTEQLGILRFILKQLLQTRYDVVYFNDEYFVVEEIEE